jgi:hypothetical protein
MWALYFEDIGLGRMGNTCKFKYSCGHWASGSSKSIHEQNDDTGLKP